MTVVVPHFTHGGGDGDGCGWNSSDMTDGLPDFQTVTLYDQDRRGPARRLATSR